MAEVRGEKIMNKNTIIRAVSAFLAAGVLFATAGCGKEKAEQLPDLSQPNVENSTVVIEYTSKNEKGEEVPATTVLNVNTPDLNKPKTGLTLKEKLESKSEAERFEKYKENYGLDNKEYKELVEKADEWVSFNYLFYLANSTSSRIVFRKLKYNESSDVLIDGDLGCEYGIPSGGGMSIVISGFIKSSKYETEEALKAALAEMGIQIIYTPVDSIDDSIDDWSAVESKTMDIDFTK